MTTTTARPTGPSPTDPSYAGSVFTGSTNGVAMWRATAWGAIFAGAVTAIVVQFVLTVLGIAIGISVAPEAVAGTEQAAGAVAEAAEAIGIGAGVWWLVTGTLSLLIGGMVLGRLWMHEDTVVGGPLETASDHDSVRAAPVAWAHRGRAPRGHAGSPFASLDMHIHALALWGVVAIFGFLVIWSGAGLAAGAASPLATVMGNQGAARAERYIEQGDTVRAEAAMEAAHDAGQTAAWWSVVGMIAGLVATAGGAAIAAGATHSTPSAQSRDQSSTSRREPTGHPTTA